MSKRKRSEDLKKATATKFEKIQAHQREEEKRQRRMEQL